MRQINIIFQRELTSYFATPVAYVFIVIFLFMSGLFTFYIGGLYERGQADLQPFFAYLPWLYLFLIPAISMRLWSEERKSGTIELLMTLPVSTFHAVMGKFLAAWVFTIIALSLTFPLWLTVNYLGNPDNGVIFAGYCASAFMAGAYLAVGACISATTKSQVIAFVISVVICFLFVVSGFPMVLDFFQSWAPDVVLEMISATSFLTHFNAIVKGLIDLRDVVFFVSFIIAWLVINVVVVELRKAD